MVGDVKQSIYKFRQARPELFLEKYSTYALKEEQNVDSAGLKIQLFKNFRSRKSVLDITNLVFKNIMSEKLGNVEYNEKEYLNYGANYLEPEEDVEYAGVAELHIIDLKEQEEDYYKPESDLLVPGENETSEALKDYKAKNIGRNPVKELEETDDDENEERIEDVVLEARFVAKQIQKLLQSDYHVFDKKERLSKN